MKKIVILLLVCLCIPTSIIYANDSVLIGGDSIGIEGYYEGLYVNGTFDFKIEEETINPSNTIHINDIIVAINDKKTENLTSFQRAIGEFDQIRNEVPLTLLRDNKKVNTTFITTNNKDGVQCGLYLKEKILGIGTLTFYNPETNTYGALGHGISEEANEKLQSGNIYESNINSVEKSSVNDIGEKVGDIIPEKPLGDIKKNVNLGIFGTYFNQLTEKETFPIANNDEVTLGKAYFYTVIKDQTVEKFEMEITRINNENIEKAIEFKVVDKNLINKTGGIIHGMSGSPIIQNGKIIGAITLVVVEDPKQGYAIFINSMIDASK